MDLGLLLWAFEKGANPDSFGPGLTQHAIENRSR